MTDSRDINTRMLIGDDEREDFGIVTTKPPLNTPRDVANIAETTVVSLPQHAYGVLLSAALAQSGTPTDVAASKAAGLDAALAYLEADFEGLFSAASGSFEDPLKTATHRLVDCLTAFNSELADLGGNHSTATLTRLAGRVDEDLSPKVTAFLTALFDAVVAFETSTAVRAKDVDSDALAEIGMISRKITFIAVNASVEAARAGDVGKAFAVIASEIKELSQQSKNAVERVRAALL